jgi:ferric-dicitrate binding protein FerR (iron transport regulator)
MDKAERIRQLLIRQLTKSLTSEEAAELRAWLSEDPRNRDLMEELSNASVRPAFDVFRQVADWDAVKKKLHPNKRPLNRGRKILLIGFAMAAAILGVVIILNTSALNKPMAPQKSNTLVVDIPPGSNRATLTLSDGSTIILDSAGNGRLAVQGAMEIRKREDGELEYVHNNSDHERLSKPLYNIIQVPRAGKYQITLPDGTKVWLNAASTLRYPVIFDTGARIVELSGEAYFEVSRHRLSHRSIPFQVKVQGMTINVLGTRFNVHAYPEEDNIRTALLEGKVQVIYDTMLTLLRPCQEAILQNSSGQMSVQRVDTSQAVDWMTGTIRFDNDNFDQMMRKIARWYDVEVTYTAPIKGELVSGEASRSRTLLYLLTVLERVYDTVQFQLEGRTIIVSPIRQEQRKNK